MSPWLNRVGTGQRRHRLRDGHVETRDRGARPERVHRRRRAPVEAEWQSATPATDFVQQQPREGAPATHRSEVRFLYDDDNLYVGGRFTEDEIDRLVVNELKRDFIARDGDLVVLNLDTFKDKLNAYNFQTNPACALRDSQSYDEGRNINANWDGVWTCRSTVEADGFVIEQAIPFKQLRFPRQAEQEWGLNIFRLIRHSNEQTIWTGVPRQFNQFKMSYAGVLDGISDVKPGRNIRVKPFVIGNLSRRNNGNDASADGGLDVKIGLGTNLVLDATWRTDFSQVEVDTQQVNLTRFSLFFPESREFFLENQGNFQIGGFTNTSNNLIPFFSRTIGLSDTGTPIPIVGGVRLTGRVGRTTVGVLNMQTEEETRVGRPALPAANFTGRPREPRLLLELVGGRLRARQGARRRLEPRRRRRGAIQPEACVEHRRPVHGV